MKIYRTGSKSTWQGGNKRGAKACRPALPAGAEMGSLVDGHPGRMGRGGQGGHDAIWVCDSEREGAEEGSGMPSLCRISRRWYFSLSDLKVPKGNSLALGHLWCPQASSGSPWGTSGREIVGFRPGTPRWIRDWNLPGAPSNKSPQGGGGGGEG